MSDQITVRIDSIIVRERHRHDMGDIAGLADSIANNVGLLLQRIVVRRVRGKWHLVAGARRLAAAKALGWETVPVEAHLDMDDATALRAEFAENTHRKNFTPSEVVTIMRALEPIEREAAQKRMCAGRPSENCSEGKGNALDKIAKAAGLHRTTLVKARAVVEAAEAEPDKFGPLVEQMDRTGRVDGPYKRLIVARKAVAIRAEPPPYPNRGPYRVIVADVPWPYEVRQEDPSHRATHPYPQMSIEQICAEGSKVRAIAHEDCILWFWVTNHHMRHAFAVLDAWGFQEKPILTWVKDRFGTGDWLRGQTEHCIMAVRGKPVVELTNQSTVLFGPLRANSQKPVAFYDFVEKLCPAPRYADLFSRYQHNEKWDCHGNEAPAPDSYDPIDDINKRTAA